MCTLKASTTFNKNPTYGQKLTTWYIYETNASKRTSFCTKGLISFVKDLFHNSLAKEEIRKQMKLWGKDLTFQLSEIQHTIMNLINEKLY